MSEGPKLFTNKPKKGTAQVKQFQQQQQMKGGGSSASPAPTGAPPPPTPPPPPPPKESFARRYKFMWPLLLTVNLAVGAYLFMRTKKSDTDVQEEVVATPVLTTATSTTPPPVTEKPEPSPSITVPVKLPDPIPEDEQREIFKWMLEEKRKVKPKSPEEKKRIDEEKAILKHFIRATSIPTF